jgi:protein-S-isoprenylcysteine O-methyltransferase Ste14
VDWLAHDSGHLLEMMFGWQSNPHFGPFHLISSVFIGSGFWLLSAAWSVLYRAQRSQTLATSGAYARIRHPQYVGFVLIMLGFLFQWPTLLTLVMFPILVFMYMRLAKREERDAAEDFGAQYEQYRDRVPAFIPRWSSAQNFQH